MLIDKVASDRCSGYTADYTRCYLDAGAGERGELVDVVCEELHADGIRVRTSGASAPPSAQDQGRRSAEIGAQR